MFNDHEYMIFPLDLRSPQNELPCDRHFHRLPATDLLGLRVRGFAPPSSANIIMLDGQVHSMKRTAIAPENRPECPKRKPSYSSIFRCELSFQEELAPFSAGILEAVEPYAPAIRALRAGDVTDKKSRSKVIRKYIHVHFLFFTQFEGCFWVAKWVQKHAKANPYIYIYMYI